MRNALLSGVATWLLVSGAAAAAQTPPVRTVTDPQTPAPASAVDEAPVEGEVVVTGQRAQQERALRAKREAIGVIDVAASDEIGRLPDRNVAEVVERLPGVGVTYDQGEGRFVAVRGVPSNLNGYTLNGLEIGNPDGNTRALPLDVVSGQLVNRVEVAKVKTADKLLKVNTAALPDYRFADNAVRGYARVDLTRARAEVTFRAIRDPRDPRTAGYDLARFTVESDNPVLHA